MKKLYYNLRYTHTRLLIKSLEISGNDSLECKQKALKEFKDCLNCERIDKYVYTLSVSINKPR